MHEVYMNRVEFIKKWTKLKKGRYSDLNTLYGSEIIHMIKEDTMRDCTYNRILSCMETIENIESGNIKNFIDRNQTSDNKKIKFLDYFSENPKKISDFKHYSRGLIDIDAILDETNNYSSYIDDIFINFVSGNVHPLKDLYDILENDLMAKKRLNAIYHGIYGGQKNYFSGCLLECQSFRKATILKINKVVAAYKNEF